MKPYGLVLAGGGAKGAYQIGAWKAMRELHIPIEAITGVSIGAINGALIAEGDYEKALELWTNVEVKSGVNLQTELKEPENLFSISNMPLILTEMLRNGGVDVTPARNLIGSYVHEDKVRASGIPLGIVTFQVSGFKPVEVFLDEIPEGELLDYLMLSARFPGLHNDSPDGERYLDGGIYDNAPVDFLRRRGYNRLIVVDISGMKGVGHRADFSNAEFVYIRPHDPKELGESFEFDKSMVEMRMEMGYLDTMKAFGHYMGKAYYFKPKEYRRMLEKYGYNTLPELEALAEELEIPRVRVYTERQFMRALLKEAKEKATLLERAGLTQTLLRVAQPILDKASEELLQKFKKTKTKKEEKKGKKEERKGKKEEKTAKSPRKSRYPLADEALKQFSEEMELEKQLRKEKKAHEAEQEAPLTEPKS